MIQYQATATSATNLLQKARQRFSQTGLARELGVTSRTISRWESGEIPFPQIIIPALEKVLSIAPFEKKETGLFTFIDLFAGIGGIRLGFQELGGECVYTSEWNEHCQKTYSANFGAKHPLEGDITRVEADTIPDHDVLLAGFPCQPFSIAGVSKKNALGKPHGFECTTQGTLFFDVARIIAAKQPKAFLLENVKNLVSHDKGNTFRVIYQILTEQLGYDVYYQVINGKRFVPQNRERIMIVGFREPTPFSWDDLQYPNEPPKLKSILHPEDGSEVADGVYTFGTKAKVQGKYTLTDHLWAYLQAYAAKHKAAGNGFGYGLVTPEDTARTLSARYYKDGSEVLVSQGKRKNPRRLTPRECARLMGFPDNFEIPVSDTQAYKQFSQSAIVPMVSAVAKLMLPVIMRGNDDAPKQKKILMTTQPTGGRENHWTDWQLKLAFHLYCQLPFGTLHYRNPQIINLAQMIGRTPSAVAMKLVNFASLDPAIRNSGRKGLGNASAADKRVWDEFHANWELLTLECDQILLSMSTQEQEKNNEMTVATDYTGESTSSIIQRRIGQNFFRKTVLASYQDCCCMSGVSHPQLLVASHIVPWSENKHHRLNPRNGLCLSAIHDRAFDNGLITVKPNLSVLVSNELKMRGYEGEQTRLLLQIEGRKIELPHKFQPEEEFLSWHFQNVFRG